MATYIHIWYTCSIVLVCASGVTYSTVQQQQMLVVGCEDGAANNKAIKKCAEARIKMRKQEMSKCSECSKWLKSNGKWLKQSGMKNGL